MQRKPDRRVVRLIVTNWIAGSLLGVLIASMFLLLDVGGLGSLLMRSDSRIVALALLFGGFAVTFASLVTGTAIMLLPKDDPEDRPPRGGRGVRVTRLVPIPVRAQRPRR